MFAAILSNPFNHSPYRLVVHLRGGLQAEQRAAETMKPTVLYPLPSMGHVPMVELAMVLYPMKQLDRLCYLRVRISKTYLVAFLESVRLNNSQLRDFLIAHRRTADVRAVVLDFFCVAALDVTGELRLPTQIFFSSSASGFAVGLYLATTELSFFELGDELVHFPGLPPIAVSDIPDSLKDRAGEDYNRLVTIFQRMLDARRRVVATGGRRVVATGFTGKES